MIFFPNMNMTVVFFYILHHMNTIQILNFVNILISNFYRFFAFQQLKKQIIRLWKINTSSV